MLVLSCLTAPAALGQATPDFTVDPASPIAGDVATFNPSDIPGGATVTWQYEPPGSFVPDTTHTFATAGSYVVTMRVAEKSNGPVTDYPKTVTVRPVAAFHRDPPESVVLVTGQEATFTSDSVPWSGQSISSLKWDVDGDGFDDGTGDVLTHSFTTSGNQIVRLEVEQSNGERDIATSIFRVNAPPVAGFVWAPGSPSAGAEVQLYSTSVDPEGAIADQSQAWELDGDADFDDAFGPVVTQTFTAGDHEISLRVTDGDGVSRTITRTITVAAPVIPAGPSPAAPVAPAPPTPPELMKPFPTVRLVGVVLPRGARITFVEVRGGPRGARVTVRCTGKGCPFRSRRLVAETGRVRLSDFKRVLAAGTRIEVFVRAPNVIGRYVAFRIRAAKPPLRADRCLMPGASEPTRCT